MAVSQCRQNYHAECEAGVNRQINMELHAGYCYDSMAFYFLRDDVALRGFAKYFSKTAHEEKKHAEQLMAFQNDRGGRIVLQDIKVLRDRLKEGRVSACLRSGGREFHCAAARKEKLTAVLQKPDRDEWGTGLEAMQVALQLERSVNQSLLDLHRVATQHSDPHMTDYLEENYLKEQVRSMKEIADHITNLKRVGPGLGELYYDRDLLCGCQKNGS